MQPDDIPDALPGSTAMRAAQTASAAPATPAPAATPAPSGACSDKQPTGEAGGLRVRLLPHKAPSVTPGPRSGFLPALWFPRARAAWTESSRRFATHTLCNPPTHINLPCALQTGPPARRRRPGGSAGRRGWPNQAGAPPPAAAAPPAPRALTALPLARPPPPRLAHASTSSPQVRALPAAEEDAPLACRRRPAFADSQLAPA